MFTAGNSTCFFNLRPFEKAQPETSKHTNILRAYTEETEVHIHFSAPVSDHNTGVTLA